MYISRSNFTAIGIDTNFLCHLTKKDNTYICIGMLDKNTKRLLWVMLPKWVALLTILIVMVMLIGR